MVSWLCFVRLGCFMCFHGDVCGVRLRLQHNGAHQWQGWCLDCVLWGWGVLCVFMGTYVGCGWGQQLVLHQVESCKGLGFNSPASYKCLQICVIANKISKIKNLCLSNCAYPFVSLILTTCKSISGQGRKMNMISYPAWHKYVKKISMHIRMLSFYRKYVILVFLQ